MKKEDKVTFETVKQKVLKEFPDVKLSMDPKYDEYNYRKILANNIDFYVKWPPNLLEEELVDFVSSEVVKSLQKKDRWGQL